MAHLIKHGVSGKIEFVDIETWDDALRETLKRKDFIFFTHGNYVVNYFKNGKPCDPRRYENKLEKGDIVSISGMFGD
jgi:hypothetical protein